jgi:hypothetical protein
VLRTTWKALPGIRFSWLRLSSSQRRSLVPLKYQLEPLHVPVAVAAPAALYRGAGRDRERPRVALVAVGGVVDWQLGLAGADHRIGEAVGAGRAEVGVQAVAAV